MVRPVLSGGETLGPALARSDDGLRTPGPNSSLDRQISIGRLAISHRVPE
jgi:hypothetical protein